MELWVRDSSRGCADSCHLCLLQKSSRTCCSLGPARVKEVSRDSAGHAQGQGVLGGTSDTELSTSSGVRGAGLVRRGCPGAGVPPHHSLSPGVTQAGAARGRLKAVPGWIGPTARAAPSLHPCLHPKLLRSSPQLARGQARNNTKPHLPEPRPGQTRLFWLRTDRRTSPSLAQHSHPVHSTAVGQREGSRSMGRAE